MNLGMSMTLNMLKGKNLNRFEHILISEYGNVKGFLKHIKAKGIDYIELRDFIDKPPVNIQHIVRFLLDLGFKISIHGKLATDYGFFEYYDKFHDSITLLNNYQKDIIFTLHSACDKKKTLEENSFDTLKCLSDWSDEIIGETSIKLALELNRQKGVNDPSADYPTLERIITQLPSKNTGICWDFGHHYYNCKNKAYDKKLSTNLINRTIHTHLHDLSIDGVTHFPFSKASTLPLNSYVEELKAVDYKGILNIELSLDRLPENDIVKNINYTIDRVKYLY